MKVFNCDKYSKLSNFIIEKYQGAISYGTVMKLLRKKDIKVNGVRVNKDVIVSFGDEISVYYDGEKTYEISVIYIDENLLICDKPTGITSEDYELVVKKTYPTAELCHRLDRNTDGILCFSLNQTANAELLNAFKNRTVKKYYLCEVYGSFNEKEGTLTAYLIKNAKESTVKIFKRQIENSVKIITKYKTLKRSGGTSLLEVELVTGKTHQIRAHLAHEGHFIIGDGKYGNMKINALYKAKGQRLTAYKIAFETGGALKYLSGKEFKLLREVYGVNK